MRFQLHQGDCLEILRGMPDCSIDSVVCDPPYGLSFMGRKWDYDVPSVEIWAECLRVLKPGGHLLAFAGTRTQHRMAVRIEDAGFEIRDMIAWVYGSGFPKSLDVSKALEAYAKTGRSDSQVTGDGRSRVPGQHFKEFRRGNAPKADFTPTTDAARQWQGWGTALKPSLEPVTVARKPLTGTVAENVLSHGTGALNIDGCRVATSDKLGGGMENGTSKVSEGWDRPWRTDADAIERNKAATAEKIAKAEALGRWPANLIHDGSEEVLAGFPVTSASKAGGKSGSNANPMSWTEANPHRDRGGHDDNGGSAARFFYCAKASKADRGADNSHPTVKPTDLMRYLCRLVTPPCGVVLDPFMGSGSTGKAAILEGFQFIGCELSEDYIAIARARIEAACAQDDKQQDLFA